MSKQKGQLDRVIFLIGHWMTQVSLSNALNYYDINKVSEGTAMCLLNLVFGYRLVDLNRNSMNFPGIDLGDEDKGIAFQVTSQVGTAKIKYSLKQFYDRGLDKLYPKGLKFFLLNFSNKKVRPVKEYQGRFDIGGDVISANDLIREIGFIYHEDSEGFRRIYKFLNEEFGGETPFLPDTVLRFNCISEQISFYQSAFRATYQYVSEDFVPFSCRVDGEGFPVQKLMDDAIRSCKIVVLGASGLGKSMLSLKMALVLSERGHVPVLIEAKYYEKDLGLLIGRKVTFCGFDSAASFFKKCKEDRKNILIVVDGLNECVAEGRGQLIAELAELSRQTGADFIISAQTLDSSLSVLDADVVNVGQPDMVLKSEIAAKYSSFTDNLGPLLQTATTSLEAKLIGEIGAVGVDRLGRFELFELFFRKRLSVDRTKCIALLSGAAKFLSDRISFSLSFRQMEGICSDLGFGDEVLELCFSSGLLVEGLGKISFFHEMFLDFFVADSIIRNTNGSKELIELLQLPIHRERRILVLGAIEDRQVLAEVLAAVYDVDLLYNIYLGECGLFGQAWAKVMMEGVWLKLENETTNVLFEFTDEEYYPLRAKVGSLQAWSSQEVAFAYTIRYFLWSGLFIDRLFSIVGLMDKCCKLAFDEMFGTARERKVRLRDELFTVSYTSFNGTDENRTVLPMVISSLHSGFGTLNGRNEIQPEQITSLLGKKSLAYGEFYLLLVLCRYDGREEILFPYILNAVTTKWKGLPYRLKTELLDRMGRSHRSEDERLALISALDTIHAETSGSMMSTLIFDALSSLGALEEDALSHEEVVVAQLEEILQEPDNVSFCISAGGIFFCQFDHPYDYAYSMAVSKLDGEKEKIFYRMALAGSEGSMFLSSLIITAESVLGEMCCPYLLKFTEKPIAEQSMPHDGLSCFILCYILLGVHSFEINGVDYLVASDQEGPLFACGELFYWLNRADLSLMEREAGYAPALKYLFEGSHQRTLEAVWQTQHALRDFNFGRRFKGRPANTILDFFPTRISACARIALADPGAQKGVFLFEREGEITKHAIDILGDFGDVQDIALLHKFTGHSFYGSSAIRGIKRLGG